MSSPRVLLQAAPWLSGLWLLWRVRLLGPGRDGPLGTVAVVVPARDEEANLAGLLSSLAAQTRPADEVLVVDDHSTDATATVARRAGTVVVEADPLPQGWTGKAWACWTGARLTTADTLVFLDADTTLAPDALARLVAEHGRHGGLLSVQPFHRTRRPYEWLSAFFNVVAMMGVDAFSPLGGRLPPSGAFGPCLVTRRSDYGAVGGHRAVRGEVLDDVRLGLAFRRAGLPVRCYGGRGTVAFRMYPAGLGSLVEGWSKNFASGAGVTRLPTLALILVWLSGCLAAGWYPARTLFGGGPPVAASLGLYAAYAAQLQWMLGRVGRFGPAAAVFPVPLAFFVVVFVRSLVSTVVLGRVRWKGRTIPTGR